MCLCFFFLMIRLPPRSTRTDTLFPVTSRFRSGLWAALMVVGVAAGGRDVWQPLKAMWPVQGQAGVQPRQAWQSPLSGGGAALSGLLAANGAQGGLTVALGTPPGFSPVASSAQLDAFLEHTRPPVMLGFFLVCCVSCLELENLPFLLHSLLLQL